ncbi:hypothetical protein JCM1840_006255 [Sporobolomyces johnsonii]
MPSAAPVIPTWVRPALTQEDLDYADLAKIDLSKWPARKEELVEDLRRAVTEVGFWYVQNYGISDDEVIRQHSIGDAFLNLPLDEKRQHPCNFKEGNFFGFREGFRIMGTSGVKDNSEAKVTPALLPFSGDETDIGVHCRLCLPKITPSLAHEFPAYDFLGPCQGEIEAFQRKIHERILVPLLSLFALLLELPEDYFAAAHAWDRATEDHLRYMRYTPNSKEVDERLPDKQYLNGHTDFGLVTLLFPQVVQGLQILTPEGQWKYVPYLADSVIVNTADVLSFATGGWIKSTIHRVVRPPDDQAHVQRLGLFYFSRAAHDWPTDVIAPSPVLKREGIYKEEDQPKNPVSGLEFTRQRVKHAWDRPVYSDREETFEIKGLKVKTLYN